MKPPIPNSYWVEPGKMLAGEHPDGGDEARTRDRISRIVGSGVRHFFDLTQPGEMPSYRWLLPGDVAYHSFAIPDHSLPASLEVMRDILVMFEEVRAPGAGGRRLCPLPRRHRPHGHRRRLLPARAGESPNGALDELNRLWQQNARAASWPTVPETDEQSEFIRRWVPVGWACA